MEVIFALACILMHVTVSHSQGIMDLLGGMGPQVGPFNDPALSRLTSLGNLSPSELAVLLSSPQNQAHGAAHAAGPGPMDPPAFPGAMGMGMGMPGLPGMAGMPMGMMEPSEMMEAMAFMGNMGAMGGMGGMGPMGGVGGMGLGGPGAQGLSAPTLVETTYVIPETRSLTSRPSTGSGLSALQLLVPQRQTSQALLVKPSATQQDTLQRLDQQRRLEIILQARQALARRNQPPPGGEGAAEGAAGAGAGGAGGGGEIPGPGERSMAELLGAPVPSGGSRGRGQVAVLRAPLALVANVGGRGLARSDPLFRPGASAQTLELAAPRVSSPSGVWGYKRPGGLAVPRG